MISVIIPCYNSERYLLDCLKSVLNQNFKDFEIICIDDGSTDSTHKILKLFQKNHPDLIKVFQLNRGGASKARNFGLEHAKGEFIQFLDSDDVILPEKFSKQIKGFNEEIDMVVSDWGRFDVTLKNKLMENTFVDINKNKLETAICKIIITSNPIYRKHFILKIGGYNESLDCAQDWEFHLRAIFNNVKINYVEGFFLKSREVQGSISSNWIKVSDRTCFVVKNYKEKIINHPEFNQRISSYICSLYFNSFYFSKDEEFKKIIKKELNYWSKGIPIFFNHRILKLLYFLVGFEKTVFLKKKLQVLLRLLQ